MKPFLLLATRAEDAAAAAEHSAFLRYGNLTEGELVRHRLERDPLPALDLDEYSGVIVGGSPFNASDADELKSPVQHRVETELSALLDEIIERDFPFLGACYGVATLGVHRGGVVDTTYGEVVGATSITLTAEGRADPILDGVPDHFQAFVGHKEACTVLPADATLLATSATCPVQMFRVGANVYATQFHPELDSDGLLTRIAVYDRHGYYPSGAMEEIAEAARHADVSLAPRVLSNFTRRHRRA
ncbi:glutamine amidotransferase [Ruania halotolerans]|nr:glutamine amidotransferase [Ruania halotolerans]UFU08311.1 glutamine amidotransferase [Ruania halotolerans]